MINVNDEVQVKCPISVVGTGVMGASLSRNLARNLRKPVAIFDIDPSRVNDLVSKYPECDLRGFVKLDQFVAALSKPRVVLIMVPAGPPVDSAIASLMPLIERGDIIIDGGNANYKDTDRRHRHCESQGVRFIGMGVSGGQQGALWGPSLMVGGEIAVWSEIRPLLEPIAAKSADGHPCLTFCGSGASGHFTKMVHNGIEYSDLQLLAETYAALRAGGYSPRQIADILETWNVGESQSYLLECATQALRATDAKTGNPLIDYVLDEAKGKGTGAWTVAAGAEYGVSVSVIAEAFFSRIASSSRNERRAWASRIEASNGSMEVTVETIRLSFLTARLIAYQQGISLLRAASEANKWNTDIAQVVRGWRAGCIIRAGFLDHLSEVLSVNPNDASFLVSEPFISQLSEALIPMKQVVSSATLGGIPMPATSAALNHQLTLMSDRLPTALVQLQRDYFGSHTYERIDAPGRFHVIWEEDKREVQQSL